MVFEPFKNHDTIIWPICDYWLSHLRRVIDIVMMSSEPYCDLFHITEIKSLQHNSQSSSLELLDFHFV